ncbi:MAG: transketolase family protein [Bryobacteraceae bacterium]|nr:transketolase family protein [Bryobacteraceae bacterium]
MAVRTKYELKLGAATREAFGKALVELGREHKDVVVLDADLSKSTMTAGFAKEFPDRFFECGIAEANMISIAGGLAAAGKIPFASSFSCFLLNKGFEQMRVAVAYPNTNAKFVGTHSGISIGEDGPSQMSIEDLGLACSLPGFTVVSPADEISMKAIVKAVAIHPGPVFVRAGRIKVAVIYNESQQFTVGKAIELQEGTDVTLIAHGLMVAEALKASDMLDSEGVSARVLDMHTIKPIDREAIARAARETKAIVVAEEHLTESGLGVRVAQVVSQEAPCVMEYVGIENTYAESGTPDGLLQKYGLTAEKVAEAARKVVRRKS